jgi:RNA polymerase sigma-70 factor (ECF subfamily)
MHAHDSHGWEALRRLEPGAIEEWFLAHADLVYTFAFYRVGKDPDVAADVVQETFLAALDRIEQYDPVRGSMAVWLQYVARNRIRDANRERARLSGGDEVWDRIDARLEPSVLGVANEELPPEVLERRERAELVQMTLANLPERYRRALVEHYVDQRSLAEMASRGETTAGAVKSLLFRARAAFRAAFVVISGELGRGLQDSGRAS